MVTKDANAKFQPWEHWPPLVAGMLPAVGVFMSLASFSFVVATSEQETYGARYNAKMVATISLAVQVFYLIGFGLGAAPC